jgi:succinoglycan biosynthesis transport protein ExoP
MVDLIPQKRSYSIEHSGHDDDSEMDGGLRILMRQWPLIATVTALVVGLAILYLLLAPSKYTATTTVMIATHTNQVFEKTQIIADAPLESPIVDSQVEVARSESVLLATVRKLRLDEDPEFVKPQSHVSATLMNSVVAYLSNGAPSTQLVSKAQAEQNAVEILSHNIRVKRVDRTYAISIAYTSADAIQAARIANGIADAFIRSDLDARFLATRQTGEWLEERIRQLLSASVEADEAVRRFKEEHDLVGTSRGLLSQQQLTDLTTQLIQAQAITSEAKAKFESIQKLTDADIATAQISDALKSDVISRLRAQYLDLKARVGDWAVRYGENHLAVVGLRNQMREIASAIDAELRRIIDTYSSDYNVALARERSIEASVKRLASQSAGPTGRARDQLRILEDTAQSYRTLYQNFLQRSTEASQQQTFSLSGTRVITPATPPTTKSSPKSILILSGAIVFGGLLGSFAAILRERMDSTFRTEAQIEKLTGLVCLGIVPKISMPNLQTRPRAQKNLGPPRTGDISHYVVQFPFSRFAETLRKVKVAADNSSPTRDVRVLGFVSALPDEGKSTMAINFVSLLSTSNSKALLIDCDLRNPKISKELIGDVDRGLLALIEDPNKFHTLLHRDPTREYDFLPMETDVRISHSSNIISSLQMADILSRARSEYDYVILDLPPITPVVDVVAVRNLIDKFVLVVEWGVTSKVALGEVLDQAGVRERILGIILNKADSILLKRFEAYRGLRYSSYYN